MTQVEATAKNRKVLIEYTSRHLQALQDNVGKYEALHGPIEVSGELPPGEFRH